MAVGALSACSGGANPNDKWPGLNELTLASAPPQNAVKRVDGVLAVADRLAANGDISGALALYRQAAIEPGAPPEAMIQYGRALFSTAAFDLAAGAYANVLASNPVQPDAIEGLGASLLAQGRPADARAPIEQAVRGSATPRTIRGLAVLRTMEGELEEARLIYRKALAMWPTDLDLKINHALNEALAGDCDTATTAGQEVLVSPYVRTQHVATQALVFAICGRVTDADLAAERSLSAAGAQAMHEQAIRVRTAATPAEKAAAIGVVARSVDNRRQP